MQENHHTPDPSKLPKVLASLPWEQMTEEHLEQGWYDMDEYLVAVPVLGHRSGHRPGDWGYELSVVTVRCDEDYFAVLIEGDSWGWDMSDVDYFVRLT
ncbi:MAG: hypothetical protein ACYSW8_26940 [Planctomycetota bacterium]|jgi:hypothetical protein